MPDFKHYDAILEVIPYLLDIQDSRLESAQHRLSQAHSFINKIKRDAEKCIASSPDPTDRKRFKMYLRLIDDIGWLSAILWDVLANPGFNLYIEAGQDVKDRFDIIRTNVLYLKELEKEVRGE